MSSTNNFFVSKVLLRQSISSVRLVIALFAITAAITKLLYNRFLPDLADIDELRWAIIGLGCVFFATTYIHANRAFIVTLFSFLLYLLTLGYVIAFVLMNHFDPNAVIILILVLGASTIIMNSLLYYGAQSLLVVLASLLTYLSTDLSNENFIAFLNLMASLGVFTIVVIVRLKLVSNIKNSYSSLEKLNVLSIVANKTGEIVFVSPSVKNLLGYDPNELVKSGWWEEPNVQAGWIDREYILNYPNIVPNEIATIETVVHDKNGKPVWLSWANSILPNGNYLGLGLDVTRYKK